MSRLYKIDGGVVWVRVLTFISRVGWWLRVSRHWLVFVNVALMLPYGNSWVPQTNVGGVIRRFRLVWFEVRGNGEDHVVSGGRSAVAADPLLGYGWSGILRPAVALGVVGEEVRELRGIPPCVMEAPVWREVPVRPLKPSGKLWRLGEDRRDAEDGLGSHWVGSERFQPSGLVGRRPTRSVCPLMLYCDNEPSIDGGVAARASIRCRCGCPVPAAPYRPPLRRG